MSSLFTNLNSSTAQEIVNWVTTAAGSGAFTLPTRLNSTIESRGLWGDFDDRNKTLGLKCTATAYVLSEVCQGRRDGGISVFIPTKLAQVTFYRVKMTSERLFNSFIPPQKNYTPPNKFLATPLKSVRSTRRSGLEGSVADPFSFQRHKLKT